MTTLIAALAAYSDMLADPDVPSAKIAELAGVDVSEVDAARGGPIGPEREYSDDLSSSPGRDASPVDESPAEMSHAPPPPPVPASVRAKATRRILGPDARTLLVKRLDVFSGQRAAWLWTRHRDLVEPFPPAAR